MKEKEAIEYLKTKYLHPDSPANPSKELCIMHNEVLDLAIAALKEEDKRKKKSVTLEQIKEIVDYLNQVCETKYKYNNKQTQSYINARFSEGYTMEDFKNVIDKKAKETGDEIQTFQSNHEGAIIDRIQEAYFDGTTGIVINPGAYTHYSYAIRDALASVDIPKVEVHISDITRREEFRKISVTAPVCNKQIYGQGLDGYLQAIDFLREI